MIRRARLFSVAVCFTVFACANTLLCAEIPQPCRIEVVENASGWPVPLVELRTTHQERFVTDNAGIIALDAPELMDRDTWFQVIGHGYEIPKDGFGYHGLRLRPGRGKTLRVKVTRTILAQRIGRITGAGLFAESQKFELEKDWRESGSFGCDSVQNAVHDGKLFWFWGDTTMANYPLGIYAGTGAITPIQPLASFQPPLRLALDYMKSANGFPRGIAPMAGSGPTWISGCADVPDHNGTHHLVCSFVKIQNVMEAYEWGLAVWNDSNQVFEPTNILWKKTATRPQPPRVPQGHSVAWKDNAGNEWLLFGDPFPVLRCPATFEAWQNPAAWELLKPQTNLLTTSGETIVPHSGAIAWNGFRQRWVTVFMQTFGKPSALGELWYAEADSPLGPWGQAIKVLSHENYTFYNPVLHPEFTTSNSPILFFEGTYTAEFADHARPTPRYNYNQILYCLDLNDSRLKAAQVQSK